jgi:predicted O-methyltransferase YrrM
MTVTPLPQKLLGQARNFMESRILLSGAELDIFTKLADHPHSAVELAEANHWHPRPLTVLLDALAAMGLLVKNADQYQTEPAAAPYLTMPSPDSVLPMVRHAATIWNNWSNLTTIVKDTGGADRIPAAFKNMDDLKAFIGAMHVVGQTMADELVSIIGPGQATRLLDVGGASGTYTMAFLKASPRLQATLFDRPPVVEMARERLAAAGLLNRVTLVAGDFYHDQLPAGHDLALLSAIIHQNSPDQNLNLYRQVFESLLPGGRLIIRDHVMKPDRTSPKSGAVFAINMLVGTPGGGTYTFQEIEQGLQQAGFRQVTLLDEGEPMRGLVEACKP